MPQIASRSVLALIAAAGLGACATVSGGAESASATPERHAGNIDRGARERIVREDGLTQMTFWAREYESFPNDIEAAQRFSDTLRKGGRGQRAAEVAVEALNRFPNDPGLLTTLGLSLVGNGQPQQALRPLAMVAQAEPQNWRVRSALGAALDQLGRFPDARRAYQEALAIEPNNVRVLTNLGVSHILASEPQEAETVLRQAASLQGALPETRQNLAIALALQGKFDEAEQLERIDLPPAQAAQNMEYLRGLFQAPHRWGDLGRVG